MGLERLITAFYLRCTSARICSTEHYTGLGRKQATIAMTLIEIRPHCSSFWFTSGALDQRLRCEFLPGFRVDRNGTSIQDSGSEIF